MNRTRWISFALTAALTLSLSACRAGETPPSHAASTPPQSTAPAQDTEQPTEETGLSFSALRELEFYFASGAGGWRTVLYVDGSGGFSGSYSDSNMGSGENGVYSIQYRCDFTGRFTRPEQVNDYIYSVGIAELEYQREAGTEEIADGVHYFYTHPYGLEDAEDILIYLPGAPLAQLPEEFKSWVGYYGSTAGELPFYALNNTVHQQGFSSYDRLERIRSDLEWVGSYAAELEAELDSGDLTQEACLEKARQLAQLWDDQLNELWDCLEQRLDPADMETLTAEELEWIARKEDQSDQAAREAGGGAPGDILQARRTAQLTEERVSQLMAVLEAG